MTSLAFYPTLSYGEVGRYAQIERALLPVSSWAGYALRRQKYRGLPTDRVIGPIPVPTIPACMTHVAADCGGFVASRIWGEYRYTPEQYVDWLRAVKPAWAACMDYCCEDEITSGRPGVVQQRQDATTEMARMFWHDYRDVPWVWVPTIQGWYAEDYIRHARELKPLIDEMRSHYVSIGGPDLFRVGIGTLCARASAAMIRKVVLAVAAELPDVPLHLWGVKLSVMQSPVMLPGQVVSVDSAAWNGLFRTGRNAWKRSGLSERRYALEVALPAYTTKVQEALSQPKQMTLLEEIS